MPKQTERAYGSMPDWAKQGPISLRNYPYRAEAHCAQKSSQRQGVHPTVTLDSPEGRLWRQYFEVHLGGLPFVMEMLVTKALAELTVPEPVPMWFDPSFEPRADYVSPEYVQRGSPPRHHPPIPAGQDYDTLRAQADRYRGGKANAGDPWKRMTKDDMDEINRQEVRREHRDRGAA